MPDCHVGVFAFPFASHPFALLHLVQKLAAAAPNVRFSFFNTAKSNQMLFSKVKLDGYDNIKPCNIHDGIPEGYVFSGDPMVELMDLFISATPGNFRCGLEEIVKDTGMKISCLLTDAFLWFSSDIADEMGIPWVPFWTSGPSALSIHMYTDAILEALASEGGACDENRSLQFLPGMSAIEVGDLPDVLLQTHEDRPFPNMLYKMGLAVPRATALVLNSYDEIDTVVSADLKSKLQKVLNLGPLLLASPQSSQADESGCLSWLDKQEKASVVYISFGTFMTPSPPELLAIAEALESKQIPYIWSLADDSKSSLLDDFFKKTSNIGKVVPWCPQLQVLAHSAIGAFVTHCGWGSVLDSIGGGVPMICWPNFAEQRLNRRLIQDVWRIGVGMEGTIFTKDGMMNALDIIFSSENGNKMRKNLAELRESGKKAVSGNGSSTENFRTLLQLIESSPDG